MKVFAFLAACVAAVAGDFICVSDFMCEINCMAFGHLHGKCDENHDCECVKATDPKPRTELICLLGGQLACEINCLTSTGHFAGECDEDNNCICGDHTPASHETRHRRDAPPRGDLACRHGGDEVCAAFCHWTTGKKEGFCDAGDNCHCEPKPTISVRRDNLALACNHSLGGGNFVCNDYCKFTTEKGGKCDKHGSCVCETTIRSRSDLACKASIRGGDDVCSAFCQFTTGKKGKCDKDGNCVCE